MQGPPHQRAPGTRQGDLWVRVSRCTRLATTEEDLEKPARKPQDPWKSDSRAQRQHLPARLKSRGGPCSWFKNYLGPDSGSLSKPHIFLSVQPSCVTSLPAPHTVSPRSVSDLHSPLHQSFKTLLVTLPIAPCSPSTHTPCPFGSVQGQSPGPQHPLPGSHTPRDRMGMMQKLV